MSRKESFRLMQVPLPYSDKFTIRIHQAINSTEPPSSLTLNVKQNHVPSLSPINSSTESTPTSDSPPMKLKSNSTDFLRGSKAKSMLSSILNNKTAKRRVIYKSVQLSEQK